MAHVDPGCRMIIIGNKCDLEDRKVPEKVTMWWGNSYIGSTRGKRAEFSRRIWL